MRCAVVIGANYGDEGKGRVTSELFHRCGASKRLNVLTNGGAQRGHTVVHKYKNSEKTFSHTFHHFGAGTFDRADTYCGKDFILNPMIFCKEYEELREKGLSDRILFYRHEDCMWSTPFDMMANQILEESRGVHRHGSCGIGIWKTIQRYHNGVCMPFDRFISAPIEYQKKFLYEVRDYYVKKGIFSNSDISLKYPLFSEDLIDHFIQDCRYFDFVSHRVISREEKEILNFYDYIVFENGQGLLLKDDVNNVHTTPSNTDCEVIHDLIERTMSGAIVDMVYVSRPYLTRHGKGILPSECDKETICSILNEKTNVTNTFQGVFRYGTINLQELFQRVEKSFEQTFNGISKNFYRGNMIFTHLDELYDESSYMKSYIFKLQLMGYMKSITKIDFIESECTGEGFIQ